MAPHGEAVLTAMYSRATKNSNSISTNAPDPIKTAKVNSDVSSRPRRPSNDNLSSNASDPYRTAKNSSDISSRPRRPSNDNLQRTVSDISFELSKEVAAACNNTTKASDTKLLPPISEVEDAKCECCGMSEDCTPEYIDRVRAKFSGKWICGLCSEAVKNEEEKNGGKREEALSSHMNACSKFNKFARAYPVLYQAEAMREMLKKTRADPRGLRAKTFGARDNKAKTNKAGIARSSSCIPAITRDFSDLNMDN